MSDWLQTFLLERAGVRGVVVQLDEVWAQARGRADYPPRVAGLLGRSLAASAALAGSIKFDGRLSIQLRGSGPLRLLFSECTNHGELRGLARWDAAAGDVRETLDDDALLAITIEQADAQQRQQGLVAAQGGTLESAFETWFEQSEQLPTRIVLAEGRGRCAALMLQRLPGSGGHSAVGDDDGWNRVGHLLATLSPDELLLLLPEQLLLRLFHDEAARVFDARPLQFACSCSRERVSAMLRSLGRDEVDAALAAEDPVLVACEFCNREYRFDAIDVAALFTGITGEAAAGTTH